jgi:hypothetical protein
MVDMTRLTITEFQSQMTTNLFSLSKSQSCPYYYYAVAMLKDD